MVSGDLPNEHRPDPGEGLALAEIETEPSATPLSAGELARITAHDLAAPLRALSGLVDLLPEGDFDADTLMTLDAIRAAIDRMQAMVSGMVRSAHVRGEPPARLPVDLNELLARVRETLKDEIVGRGAVIAADKLPTVYGDEHQLERVFQNLISNALKYSGEGAPKIRITARAGPGAWRISVADEGVGVRANDRERIFGLFERSSDQSGDGVGLATCKRIVELHGGRIWVDANEPRGSIFRFALPDEPAVAAGDLGEAAAAS